MKEFTHNPTTVEAIKVGRPYHNVKNAFPFAREHKSGSGAFSHFVVQGPGVLAEDAIRAWEGDWLIKYPTGCTGVMSDAQFARNYGDEPAESFNLDELHDEVVAETTEETV